MHQITDRLTRLEAPLAKYLACPALVLLALSTFSGKGGGNTALFLLLVGLVLMAPVHWRALIRDPLFLATAVFLVWVLLVALDPGQTKPEDIAWVRNKAAEWARVLMLPALLVGFWLARVPRLMPWLPLLMVVGYTIKVVSMTTPELLEQFVAGRDRAAYDNDITRFGIYSAIGLFAAVASIWTVRGVQRRSLRVALYGVVGLCAAVATAGLVFSQTRAAWLATAAVIALCIVLALRAALKGTIRRNTVFAAATAAGVVLVAIGIMFHDLFVQRIDDDAATIIALLQGSAWQNPPADPVGLRISVYRIGLLTWLERPWLGHGPGIDQLTMREYNDAPRHYLGHFHSIYINLLATWGVVGLMLFAGVIGVLATRARRAFRAGALPVHIGIFLFASTGSLLIFGLFDQILLDDRLPFLLGILGGIASIIHRSNQRCLTRPLKPDKEDRAEKVGSRWNKRSDPTADVLT